MSTGISISFIMHNYHEFRTEVSPRILDVGRHLRDLASLSANPLPAIPAWPGTHKLWMSKSVTVRE